MRNLGIALAIAWMSVGLDLLWLPSSRLAFEISVAHDSVESMKDSPLKGEPEVARAIEQAEQLLTDQSNRAIILWLNWTALLLIVAYGLWTAYAVFRRRPNAYRWVFIGCLLFLCRQVLFHRVAYIMLLNGANQLQQILTGGHYRLALTIIWYHYVLGIFFFSLAMFSAFRLSSKRSNKAFVISA